MFEQQIIFSNISFENEVETEFSRLTVAEPEENGDTDANSMTEEAKSAKTKESSQENVPEIIEENKKTNTTTAEVIKTKFVIFLNVEQ